MKRVLIAILALFVLPAVSMATGAPPQWQTEVISLISHQQYQEAGERLKDYCVEGKSGELCLILASAYFEGEAKFGINSREIVEAYKYTRLACDYGSEAGCEASKAAIEKGELLQNVMFESGVDNRDAQLKEAIQLGADLNAATLFTTTLLQQAISEENIEAVRLLLDNGVDINYRVSDEDPTPLMYAINSGNKEMVALLLKNGADATQTMKVADYLKMGKEEVNACDFANKLENREMLALLKCPDATTAKVGRFLTFPEIVMALAGCLLVDCYIQTVVQQLQHRLALPINSADQDTFYQPLLIYKQRLGYWANMMVMGDFAKTVGSSGQVPDFMGSIKANRFRQPFSIPNQRQNQ